MKDSTYSCSSSYSDLLLSLRVCPFKVDSCGASDTVLFQKTGSSKSVSQTLYPGEVCMYNMRAECGVPSFTPSGSSVADLDIYTIQYDDTDVATADDS